MNYDKESMETVAKAICEDLGKRYPNLPFMVVLTTSDGLHFSRSTSQHLNDPNQCMKLCADQVLHINQAILNQQYELFKVMQQQLDLRLIEESKNHTKQ